MYCWVNCPFKKQYEQEKLQHVSWQQLSIIEVGGYTKGKQRLLKIGGCSILKYFGVRFQFLILELKELILRIDSLHYIQLPFEDSQCLGIEESIF